MGYGTFPSKIPNARAPSHPPHLQQLSHPSLDALTHRDNPGEVTVVAIQLMTHTRARAALGTLLPPFFFSFASPTCSSHCCALLDAPGIPFLPHPSLTLSQPLSMLSFFHSISFFLSISFLTLYHSFFFFLTISIFIPGLPSFSLSQPPFPTTSVSPPSPLPREMSLFYFFRPPRNRFLLSFPTAEHSFGCTPVFWDVFSRERSLGGGIAHSTFLSLVFLVLIILLKGVWGSGIQLGDPSRAGSTQKRSICGKE